VTAEAFGLSVRDGRPHILYGPESSLRDALARLAYIAGWDVETEHHVVGWGRPDLYLTSPGRKDIAVEVKLDLTKSAVIRKAFQQADVYAKALGPSVEVILTAPRVDQALAQQYDLAYADVWFLEAVTFMDFLYGASIGMRERHLRALRRQRDLAREYDLHTAVLERLADFGGSPVGFIPDDAPSMSDVLALVGLTDPA
jgi:hypothetical protein